MRDFARSFTHYVAPRTRSFQKGPLTVLVESQERPFPRARVDASFTANRARFFVHLSSWVNVYGARIAELSWSLGERPSLDRSNSPTLTFRGKARR